MITNTKLFPSNGQTSISYGGPGGYPATVFTMSDATTGITINNDSHSHTTSGNTGIALSALGAAMGNPVQIVMPSNMSEERKQMMRAFGANILEVAASDFDAAIQKRNEILACVDDSWSPCQFENSDNIKCHMHKTAPEIYEQIPGNTAWVGFVSGVGTGGTIMGVHNFIQKTPNLY